MGDRRYAGPYRRVDAADDKRAALQRLSDDEIVQALAHASREHDPYVANVLATETLNRVRRSRAMTEYAADGLLSIDVEGIVRSANPAAARLLGCDRDALIGMDRHDLFRFRTADGAIVPASQCPVMRVIEDGETLEGDDAWFARADGTTFPTSYTIAPIVLRDEVAGAVVCFRDRSAQHAFEEDRAKWTRLMEAFHRAHDHVGIGLLVIEGGAVTYANAAFKRMIGREAAGIPPTSRLLGLVPVDMQQKVLDHFQAVISGRAPEASLDFDMLRVDGTRVPVRGFVAPAEMADPSQRLVCIVEQRSDALTSVDG